MPNFVVRLGRPAPSAPFGPFCSSHAAEFTARFVLVRLESVASAHCLACAAPGRPMFGAPFDVLRGRPAVGELVERNGYLGAP
jgi:hypothetical protein